MTYFVLSNLQSFKCQLKQINVLNWGRECWFFCYRLLVIGCFHSDEFPLPLVAWERLHCFIVPFSGPSIYMYLYMMNWTIDIVRHEKYVSVKNFEKNAFRMD